MIIVPHRHDMYVNDFHYQSNSHPSTTSPKTGHTHSQPKHATHPYSLSDRPKFSCHRLHPFKSCTCSVWNRAKRGEKSPRSLAPMSLPSFDQGPFAKVRAGLPWSIACASTACGTVKPCHCTSTNSCSSAKVSTPYSPSTSFSLPSLTLYSHSCLSSHVLSHTSALSASISYLPWTQTVYIQEKLLCTDS